MQMPEMGDALPRRRNLIWRMAGLGILWAWGCRVEGEIPNLSKLVLVGAPHTSGWDVPIALAFIFGLELDFRWLGKNTLFVWPFRWLLRWMGGFPVDRTASNGIVGQVVDEFKRQDKFVVGLSPEGTRSRTREWKTGFYYIARGAGVPILPIVLDYPRKVISLMPLFYPTDDVAADIAFLKTYYRPEQALNPESFVS